MKNQPGNMKNQPRTMKNHENRPGTMNSQPGTMNTHENRPGTINKQKRYRQTNRTFLLYIDYHYYFHCYVFCIQNLLDGSHFSGKTKSTLFTFYGVGNGYHISLICHQNKQIDTVRFFFRT